MNLGRSISRSAARSIAREIAAAERRKAVYRQLQREAAARPESRHVRTPTGEFWMSPIEFKLYEAMLREGLSAIPQFFIQGYYVDFAFPDVRVAVEADGAAYHGADRRQRDRRREWVLRQAGWTVKRFHGSTIYQRAANCAFVIREEVEGRRLAIRALARQRMAKRRARHAAIVGFFRKTGRILGIRRNEKTARKVLVASKVPKRPNG